MAGALANRLGRIALVVDDRSIDDHLVADLDVRIAGGPLAVAEIIGLEDIETAAAVLAVDDREIRISIVSAGLEGRRDFGNLTFDIDLVGALDIRSQRGGIGRGACRIIRILEGSASLRRTGLGGAALLEGKNLGIDDFVLALGGIVLILTGEDDGSTVLDLGGPVALVGDAVDIDLARVVGQVKAAVGSIEGTDLAGKLIIGPGVGELDELGDRLGFGLAVIRIAAALGHAVQGIDIAGALSDRLGRIALVVDDLAAEDDLVADLDVRLAGGPFLIAQIIGLEGIELGAGSRAVVGDIEIRIPVGSARLEGHADVRDDAPDVDRAGFGIGREGGDILEGRRSGIRVLKGAVALVKLAFFSCLDDMEILFAETDRKDHIRLAIVSGIGDDGDIDGLGLRGGLAGGRIQGNPVRDVLGRPVSRRRQGHGLAGNR